MLDELDLFIGSINYFVKPVGRGCAWFHVTAVNKTQVGINNFILIVDEDIDLRVVTRLKAAAQALAGTPYKIAMAGERKGSITILLEPDINSNCSKQFNLSKVVTPIENGVVWLDQDFWEAKVFMPIYDSDIGVQEEEFLSAIAHPSMRLDVFHYLINKKEEEYDQLSAFFKGESND